MNKELAELSAFDEKEIKYKGPSKFHPVFARAAKIQEALQFYISEGATLRQELDSACNSLNYIADEAGLLNTPVTVIGEPQHMQMPECNINPVTGEFSITLHSVEDEEDSEENDHHYDETLPASDNAPESYLRQQTGNFAGFGFNLIPVGNPSEPHSDSLTNTTLFTGELVHQQYAGFLTSSLGKTAYFATSRVGQTSIDFIEDIRQERLAAAKTLIHTLVMDSRIDRQVIALDDTLNDDAVDTPEGMQQLSDIAHDMLNSGIRAFQSGNVVNALLDFIKYSIKLDSRVHICTDVVYVKSNGELPYVNIVENYSATIEVTDAELICVPNILEDGSGEGRRRLYVSDVIDRNGEPHVAYIPLENIIAIDMHDN